MTQVDIEEESLVLDPAVTVSKHLKAAVDFVPLPGDLFGSERRSAFVAIHAMSP